MNEVRHSGESRNPVSQGRPADSSRAEVSVAGHRCFRPYPDYKDSGVEWLGRIPAQWKVRPLFAAMAENDVRNRGLLERNVLSLSYGKVVRRDIETNFGLMPESFETYQIVEAGQLILRLTDLQNDQRSIRVGLVPKRGIMTSAYVCLRPSAAFDPRFAHYLLLAFDLLKVFYGLGAGVRQTMDFGDLKRMPVLVPDVSEQKGIADFLDRETAKVDALIEKKERLIELLQEKRAAFITRAVTRGLNPKAPLKDSGIEWLGRIPAHWIGTRLKFVANVRGGVTLGKDYGLAKLVEVPYLRVANVQDGHLDLESVATILVPEREVAAYALRKGDVLMNEGGDADKLGRGCVWKGELEPCIHQNHVFAVRPSDVLSEWLSAWTGAHVAKAFFESRAKQSTNLASISASNIENSPIAIPPRDEQRSIVAWIDEATSQMTELTAKIAEAICRLTEHRSALITAAVTGQIDVRRVA